MLSTMILSVSRYGYCGYVFRGLSVMSVCRIVSPMTAVMLHGYWERRQKREIKVSS